MNKNQNLHLGLLLAVCFQFSGCVSTRVASLENTENTGIEVYFLKLPEKKYTEYRYVQADGAIFHSPATLLKNLKKKAGKEGADAIIDVKYGYQFWWPYASAVAIKYTE